MLGEFMMIFVVVTLITVIVIQSIERFFYGQQMQAQHQKLITAFLSKDATDYAIANKVEKAPPPERVNPDQVELADADDDTFDKFINNQ